MQSIKLAVKVLFHPEVNKLDVIYQNLGKNYEQKVLPALCNEILRTVVAQFSAAQLLSQRDQVSERIKSLLSERASQFNIIIDNFAITDLTFGKEYLEAIEGKQVAQQEAERAKYEVDQAREVKKSTIIKAEASAKSIELVGQASKDNPSYLDVRKIEYMEKIAQILAESRNKVMLNNDVLNMNLPKTTQAEYAKSK